MCVTVHDRDDRELVARLQDCDQTAFAALVARHAAALRRTALSFVSTRASAEEVVQDTWLAVLAGLPAFEGRSSIKTWIFRILINRARTRGVREARTVPLPEAEAEAENRATTRPDDTPIHLLLRKEQVGALAEAIQNLPERQRAVVVLRDALGWSGGEVCDALGVTGGNQRILLHRARARLRAILAHHEDDEDDHRDVELPYHRTNDRLARRRAHAG
ncbi:MAG TPA: RNA polymerase sigma factor [Kofleriaceae bacterium]